MKNTNTGGPAFPAICQSVNGIPLAPGATLRDYFAAKAMQAIIAKKPFGTVEVGAKGIQEEDDRVARGAYDYADAMLRERDVS